MGVSDQPLSSAAAATGIFLATLVLVLTRPRGVGEGWWAALGAIAMLVFGLVTVDQAAAMIWLSRDALLFLLALLALAALLESSGLFEWAALEASRRAAGDGRRLFRNVFVLGSFVTITLSLDTTAVMLTPIVIAFVQRLRLPARPYVIGTAFVSSVGSLLLPTSNLTNLLFADTFRVPFVRFALWMLAPQLVALVATYVLLRWAFRGELARSFDVRELAEPWSVVPDRRYFGAACVVLALVLVGYFMAPVLGVEPYAVGFAGAVVLLASGLRRGRVGVRTLREIPWGLVPLVLGLFVVVRGVENAGIVEAAARISATGGGHPVARVFLASGVTAAASNVLNNLPTALLARSVLQAPPPDEARMFGALVGLDVGPTVLPTGSLATLLVLEVARRKGERVSGIEMIKIGWWLTPIVLLLATIPLALMTS